MEKVKILLVDDEAAFISALGARLELRGFDVCLANNGAQAISLECAENPDLVLMDLGLPDMNGLELMEQMKSFGSNPEVIVLSGHGLDHKLEAVAKGAFTFLTKPVKIVDLVDVIISAYEQRTGIFGD